jgi:sulfite reductase beta subunit-like hemoprotein
MNPTGIIRCLARVGSTGWMGIFGSIHPLSLRSGDRVVVATELGEFPAEIVASLSNSENLVSLKQGYYAGELLRRASEAERNLQLEHKQWCHEQLAQIEVAVAQRTNSLSILDCEKTICGQHLVIWFLGLGTAELGPLSVQLADLWKLSSVRFISPESVRSLTEKSLPQHVAQTESATWSDVLLEKENDKPRFTKESAALLQDHGIYQQKLRQSSTPHPHVGSTSTSAMVRIRRQGPFWTNFQVAKLLQCAHEWGDGWLRPTARQGWQIYGVCKQNIQPLQKQLDRLLLTSQGTCGNHPRNLTCCPLATYGDTTEHYASTLASELERLLMPKCPSYEWLWHGDPSSDSTPTFDQVTLPHKLKIGVAISRHICTEVLSNDLAIVLRSASGVMTELEADIYIGGGLAFRLDRPETSPQLAKYVCTIPGDNVLSFAHGLVQAFQKYGPRRQRRLSRLKYWLQAVGADEILRLTMKQASRPIRLLAVNSPAQFMTEAHHRGLHTYHEKSFIGIRWNAWGLDGGDVVLRTNLQSDRIPWLKRWHLTTHQEIIFGPFSLAFAESINADLEASGLSRYLALNSIEPPKTIDSNAQKMLPRIMSCASLPTCALAVSDAEGHKEELARWLAEFQSATGMDINEVDCRISGCTNNCSRPLLADIGLIAHGPNRYGIYVGGNHATQQIAQFTGREFVWGEELKEYLRDLLLTHRQL